ncbi:extracellular solute-binding protein [Agaribacter flavus]|uniref:Extracellular solute-binding protein n=1 Tax=Agaribacter flavus TaxID=1902781 RepID=A0ABV7FR54_9ALTE
MTPNRRQFIQLFGSIAASYALPFSALPSFALSKLLTSSELKLDTSNENLHLDIIELAKQYKKSSNLHLLLPEGSQFNVKPIADWFSEAVGLKVTLETVPVDDINTRILLDKRLKHISWDVALPATFGIPELAESGAIADVSQLRKQIEPQGFDSNRYYQLGDLYKGRFYGYQTDGDVYMMFYNQLLTTLPKRNDFADAFGYTYRLPKTWEELDQHLAFFHDPQNNIFGGALFKSPNYLVWEFWSRFHAKGQLPLNDDLSPNIDNEHGIAVLEDIIRSVAYMHPNARKDGLVDNWRTFAKGNIYANIGWGGTQKYLVENQSPLVGNLRYDALPGGTVNGQFIDAGYFNWGWNYTLSPMVKDPVLAYLFTLFAVSPMPSTTAVAQQKGFFDPFRKEHYQDNNIQRIYTQEFLEAHENSMKNCIPDFYMNGQQLYMGELRRYLNAAVNQKISPRKALEAAANSWKNIHEKMGVEKQAIQWSFLRLQYPKPFKEALKYD